MHFPTFKYAVRRMRISHTSPIVARLKESGYRWDVDIYSDNTLVFEFPIDQGHTREASTVSMWEQFSLLALLQREWSDNMVSVTIYFNPKTEASQIEHALAQFAPLIKSCSMLPHTEEGAYKQPPYQGISQEEYRRRLAEIKAVNWSQIKDNSTVEKEGPKYCTNDTCEL
jgi:ribonucleoside-diphosphate reductase alpha chain